MGHATRAATMPLKPEKAPRCLARRARASPRRAHCARGAGGTLARARATGATLAVERDLRAEWLIRRGGQAIRRMLADVRRATIPPTTVATAAQGGRAHADEYDIRARL